VHGLTIQWSLTDTPEGTADLLREYVQQESLARFTGMAGLHTKYWQVVDNGFFAGLYVWESAQARAAFLEQFRAQPSRVSQIVGHDPDVVREWDLVAVAEGGAGHVR